MKIRQESPPTCRGATSPHVQNGREASPGRRTRSARSSRRLPERRRCVHAFPCRYRITRQTELGWGSKAGRAHAPAARAPGSTASGGSAAEEVDQLVPLPIGQTAERLRVSDPTLGEDAAGSDRADLRDRQEHLAHPRCPHTGGWVGEDLHQLDLSRGKLLFQLRSRRPYLVRLLQRTQTLFARSARNARTGAAL